ncbi:hypothetical protein QFZ27_002208 [Inquilinus ginsengisoli]|uniref:hypothetical protein n=1 Tax=Inquilinus ginsengisoli TaxID=363840 RepID=UPI003D202EC7
MALDVVNTIMGAGGLMALPPPTGTAATAVFVKGYRQAGDGGGGEFVWTPAASDVDPGISIKPDSLVGNPPPAGRWLRQIGDGSEINVKWFGAVGNGLNDLTGIDNAAIQAALDYQRENGGEVVLPPGDYNITSTLTYFMTRRANALRMRGAGRDKSRLLYNTTNRTSCLKIRGSLPSTFMWGGHIRELAITNPRSNPPTQQNYWSQQAAIDLGNSAEMLIEDCAIMRVAGHGIWAPAQFVSVNNNDGVGNDFPNDKPWVTVDRFRPAGRPAHLQARVTFKQTTGWVSKDSNVITKVKDTSGIAVGAAISGNGIPPGTKVTVIGTDQITISNKAFDDFPSATLLISTDGAVTGFKIYRVGSGYRDGAQIAVRGIGSGFQGVAKTSFILNGTYVVPATIATPGTVTGITLSGLGNTSTSATDSTLLTVTTGTTGIRIGCTISGTGIPAGTTVAKVIDYDTLVMSAAATAAGTAVPLIFGAGAGDPDAPDGRTTGKVQVGYYVRGIGIPDGTTVVGIDGKNGLTLSAQPTEAATGPLTFHSPDSGFISRMGTLALGNPVVVLDSVADLKVGYLVSAPVSVPSNPSSKIYPDTTIQSVNVAANSITLSRLPREASVNAIDLNFISPDGGVVEYQITTPGTGYYEPDDHIFDNTDTFTTAHLRLVRTEISECDGVGLVFPHFASCQLSIENCTFQANQEGGILFGGNALDMRCSSVGVNGMHFEEGGPGFYPGVWLRRGDSNAEMIRLSQNEFDSNTYCHVLVDGVDGAEISWNRCNSWVTAWTRNTDWTAQIPSEQIKFDPGNAACQNTGVLVRSNRHRSQPQGTVPRTSVTTLVGNPIIAGANDSPLGASAFKIGATVEILNGATFVTFGPGNVTETRITAIVPTIKDRLGHTDNGSVTVSNIDTTGIVVSAPISGSGIPDGTRILGVNAASGTITMSKPATATTPTPPGRVPLVIGGTMTLALAPRLSVNNGLMSAKIEDEGVTGVDLGANALTLATEVTDPLNSLAGVHAALVANWRNGVSTGTRYQLNGAQLAGSPGTGAAAGRINVKVAEGLVVALPAGQETPIPWFVMSDPELRFVPDGGRSSRYLPKSSGIFEVAGCLTVDSSVAAGDRFELQLIQEFDDLSTTGTVVTKILELERIEYQAAIGGNEFSMPFTFNTPVTVANPYIGQNRPSLQPSGGLAGLIWWNPATKQRWRWSGTTWQLVTSSPPKPFLDPFNPNTRLSLRLLNRRDSSINLSNGTTSEAPQSFVAFKQIG